MNSHNLSFFIPSPFLHSARKRNSNRSGNKSRKLGLSGSSGFCFIYQNTSSITYNRHSSINKYERKDIEGMELNTLVKELSERVENLLKENGGDNEWN